MNWREVPFARLLLPFVTGILLAIYLPWQPPLKFFAVGLLLLTGALIYLNLAKTAFQMRWAYGLAVSIFLAWLGWQLANQYNELSYANHFKPAIAEQNLVVGTITQMQPTSTGKARLQLRLEALGEPDGTLQAASGNLLAYLDSTALDALNYGDRVSLVANITPIEPPKNPKAFDFARFMHFKNVHYQAFVREANWQLQEKANGFNLFLIADRLRDRCVAILEKHFPNDNELAVASALILGYRDEITEEVRNAYANTGAMHVLAVSGLHVGFIYLGLGFLLGLVKSDRKSWKIAKTILEILGIWSFALLTGASPSVLRAATMFSFIIIGRAIQRDANIYNTLAASAFFLLCFNPYYLMDVGFQLSYLAVLGIVYFQPKIYKLWYIENKIGDYIWKLTAVSLAAQISTLPISLYYFHQFPVYFWLSGLVVVPVAVVILCGGFLLFVTDFIPGWSWLLGKGLYNLVDMVNKAIFLIQQIPGSLVTGIWISFAVMVLIYAAILGIIIAMNTRRFSWMIAGFSCFTLVGFAHFITQWQVHQQERVVIYHTPKHTAIDYFDGKKLVSFIDNKISEKTLRFANQNYRWFRRGELVKLVELEESGGFEIYRFGRVKMAIVDEAGSDTSVEKTPVDYVLIRNNPHAGLPDLLEPFDCKKVIFDTSNNRRSVERWRGDCKELGVSYFDIQEKGAFVLSLKRK